MHLTITFEHALQRAPQISSSLSIKDIYMYVPAVKQKLYNANMSAGDKQVKMKAKDFNN